MKIDTLIKEIVIKKIKWKAEMESFYFFLKNNKNFISDENHKKIVFLFSFSYYSLMLLIVYFVFSENLGVYKFDSGIFHKGAIRYANLLKEGGLTSLPNIIRYDEYQFPSIFGGVVYYLFGLQHPFSIIIFNILIKSISAYLLYSIFFKITKQKLISFLAVFPFLFFPTEFGSLALINKGVYFSLAFIVLLYFFVIKGKMKMITLLFSFLIFSAVRPQYFHWMYNIVCGQTMSSTESPESPESTRWVSGTEVKNLENSTRWASEAGLKKICKNKRFDKLAIIFSRAWRYTPTKQTSFFDYIGEQFEKICARFDGLAKMLQHVRNDASIKTAKTNFDESTLPTNGKEFLLYIPKGLFIGLFKPYPTEWFVSENKTNKLFYLAASVEAIFIYLGLILLLFSLYKWKMKKELLYITFLCLCGILVYGTISYNLGCLYRQRSLYLNIICGIGLMYFPTLLSIGRTHFFALRRFLLRNHNNIKVNFKSNESTVILKH